MKTTMIRIFQAIFAIAAFALAIYGEDFRFRGFGMLLGMGLVGVGL